MNKMTDTASLDMNTEDVSPKTFVDGTNTTIVRGDGTGHLMNGRQFVGTLLDNEFNEIGVWYEPQSNNYFRDATTLILPERTIAYGNWRTFTTAGLYQVRKLRTFMDAQLTPDKRTPEYQKAPDLMPLYVKNQQVSTKTLKVNLEGGDLTSEQGQSRNHPLKEQFNLAIDTALAELKSIGFEFVSNWYSRHYKEYNITYRGACVYNLAMSGSGSQEMVTFYMNETNLGERFVALPLHWPYRGTNTVHWAAYTKVGDFFLTFNLNFEKSKLYFDIGQDSDVG